MPSNNFDFIRLLAATAVLLSHQFVVLGLPEPGVFPGNTWGGLAVCIFFVISGYLVTQSWIKEPVLWKFFAKRALRIFPGLLLVTLFTILIIGPLTTSDNLSNYFLDKQTWKYLSNAYLKIRTGELPGVFLQNPLPVVVNASIWSLPLEAKWYGLLSILGFLGLIRKKILILLLLIICVWWVNWFHLPGTTMKEDWFFYFGSFFLAGTFLASVGLTAPIFIFASGISIVAFYFGYWFLGLITILPVAIIYFGLMATPGIKNIGKFGDISYGVYIFSFPVQQTVVYFLGVNSSYYVMAFYSIVITYILAFLSWRFVELPALQQKKYLG